MLSLIHYQASTIYTYHKSSRAVIVHRSRVAKAIRNERRGASGRVFPRKISAKSFAASWGIHTYTEDLTRTDNFRIRRAHHILLSKYLDFRGQCIAIRLALVRSFDRLASERVRDELARGRRSSQHDAEMETVRPVRFASLFVLHVLSTFLFSCVYVFTVTKEKKPRVIAVVSSSIIV